MPGFAGRIQETTTTTGTGNLTLAGASSSFFTIASAYADSERFYYTVAAGSEAESGIGYTSAGVLVREEVTLSTNSNALVTFSAGTKTIIVGLPAKGTITRGMVMGMTEKVGVI